MFVIAISQLKDRDSEIFEGDIAHRTARDADSKVNGRTVDTRRT